MMDGGYLPPPRSIEWVKPVPNGVEILCDCATITVLELEIDPAALPSTQAFTCDGCLSVHWFTLAAATPGTGAQ